MDSLEQRVSKIEQLLQDNKFKEKYFEIQMQQLKQNQSSVEEFLVTKPVINFQLPDEAKDTSNYAKQLNVSLKNFEVQIKQSFYEMKIQQNNLVKKIDKIKSTQLQIPDVIEITKEFYQQLEPIKESIKGTKAPLNIPMMQKIKKVKGLSSSVSSMEEEIDFLVTNSKNQDISRTSSQQFIIIREKSSASASISERECDTQQTEMTKVLHTDRSRLEVETSLETLQKNANVKTISHKVKNQVFTPRGYSPRKMQSPLKQPEFRLTEQDKTQANLTRTITNITEKLKKSQQRQQLNFMKRADNINNRNAGIDVSMSLPKISKNFNTMTTSLAQKTPQVKNHRYRTKYPNADQQLLQTNSISVNTKSQQKNEKQEIFNSIIIEAPRMQIECTINTHKDSQTNFSPLWSPEFNEYIIKKPNFVNETGRIVDLNLMEKQIGHAKKQYLKEKKQM